MNKVEIRRFLAIMEFFYGFLFGVAIFAAVLAFLMSVDFLSGIFFGICVFCFFLFLSMITRYCIIRVKISLHILDSQNLNSTLPTSPRKMQ